MSKFETIFKPETALKRAEEQISTGQKKEALTDLHEWIVNKRYKSFTEAHEALMFKVIELGVELRQGRLIKEALHAYKNLALNVSLPSLERVVAEVIRQCSETDVKFQWESFRALLDVLRLNAKLDGLYQSAAVQAFGFMQQHQLKSEMRRLCDMMRTHLVQLAKSQANAQAAYMTNLAEQAAVLSHLKTRFVQLETSLKLSLYQEAFRTCEDIYELDRLSMELGKSSSSLLTDDMKAQYYKFISEVLLVGGNYLYHAVALLKYFEATKDESVRDQVVAAVLSVGSSTQNQGSQRLSVLLSLKTIPSQNWLMAKIQKLKLLESVSDGLKALGPLVKQPFDDLTAFVKDFQAAISLPLLKVYQIALNDIMMAKVFQHLQQKPQTMKFDQLLKFTTLNAFELEKYLIQQVKLGKLNVTIDHETHTVVFGKLMAKQPERVDQLLQKVQQLSKQNAQLDDEHQQALERKAKIDQHRDVYEKYQVKLAKDLAEARMQKAQQEAELERVRLQQETQKREIERIQKEREDIDKQQALKLAEELTKKNIDIDIKNLDNIDKATLLGLQIKQLESEKTIRNKKLTAIAKRLDHTERAYRQEEIPLIVKSYDAQKKSDKEAHEKAHWMLLDATKLKYERNMLLKKSLARIDSDWKKFEEQKVGALRLKQEQLHKDNMAKMQQEKDARLKQFNADKAARLQAEQEAAVKLEAEKKRQKLEAEAKEAAEKERLAKWEATKVEREAAQRVLDEKARQQMKREEEAEENRRQRLLDRQLGTSTSDKYQPPKREDSATGAYRAPRGDSTPYKPSFGNPAEKRAESATQPTEKRVESATKPETPNAYVPPWKKKQADSDGWTQVKKK